MQPCKLLTCIRCCYTTYTSGLASAPFSVKMLKLKLKLKKRQYKEHFGEVQAF